MTKPDKTKQPEGQLDMDGDVHPPEGSTNGTGEVSTAAIEVSIPEAEVVAVSSKQTQTGPRLRITLDARLGPESVAAMGLVGTTVQVGLFSNQTAFVFEAPTPPDAPDGDKTE